METENLLKKAREYEEINEKKISPSERPAFHLSPRVGWMNDPNGFSLYEGQYHLFYQYYPYEPVWGLMHWGHAVSDDLLHWEYLPAALAPDETYDSAGVFSGSAISLDDDRQLLMYTGVEKTSDEQGGKDVQTQCLAVGDGVDYEKFSGNPVITADKLPEGCDRFEFRDPKVFREDDGSFSCIVGNSLKDGSGHILLFKSRDGFSWKFKSVLSENRNRFGKMWECPDFFELDGRWVLLVSPQFMQAKGYEYHNGNGTVCFIGDYDKDDGRFIEESDQTIDHGMDFYAPQTVLTPDGRRVMIGWMQNWDTCSIRTENAKIFGQMSLPRELSIKDGRLFQKPVKELEALRCNRVSYNGVRISTDRVSFDDVRDRMLDLELCVRQAEECPVFEEFSLHFAEGGGFWSSLSFRTRDRVLRIDREHSGTRRALLHERECRITSFDGELKLRIILDRFSAEVFVNDGEQVMTCTFFTELSADGISFAADGEALVDIVKYDLIP